MYRTTGIFALVIGISLAFLWGFLPFSQQLAYRVTFEEEQPVWTRTTIDCPDPWSVLIAGERPGQGELTMVGDECVKPARTLMTGAVVALIAGLAIGGYGLSRGASPQPEQIEPLSEVIARRSSAKS